MPRCVTAATSATAAFSAAQSRSILAAASACVAAAEAMASAARAPSPATRRRSCCDWMRARERSREAVADSNSPTTWEGCVGGVGEGWGMGVCTREARMEKAWGCHAHLLALE
eukprot:scaffold393_cov104-Isochrysis_galbana.AAC.9